MAGEAAWDLQFGVFGRNEASRIGQCMQASSVLGAAPACRSAFRGDGLLGSMVAHDLDPLAQPWENRRVIGVEETTYEAASLPPLHPPDPAALLPRLIASAGQPARR